MKFCKLPLFFLKPLGVNFDANDKIKSQIILFIHVLALFLSLPCDFYYDYDHLDDINKLSDGLQNHFTGVIGVIKGFTLMGRKFQLYKVFNELQDVIEKVSKFDKDILDKYIKIERRLNTINAIASIPVGLQYVITPILENIYTYFYYGYLSKGLAIPAKFTYDVMYMPNYILTFIWYIEAIYAVELMSMGTDGLFYGCATGCAAIFEIIQKHMRIIEIECKDKQSGKIKLTKEFAELCEQHNTVLQICRKLNKIYFPVILGQFLLSSAQMCINIYRISMVDRTVIATLVDVFFMGAILFQAFIYCHGGSVLKEQSLGISNAVHFSRWVDCSPETRRTILIPLIRSQRPVIIQVATFEANLATFATILNTTWTYITILKSME